MVSVLALSALDRGFEPHSHQTKDYNICICCFSAQHAALRCKTKDGLTPKQDNVYLYGLFFNRASTIKIQLNNGVLVQYKADIIIKSSNVTCWWGSCWSCFSVLSSFCVLCLMLHVSPEFSLVYVRGFTLFILSYYMSSRSQFHILKTATIST